MKFSALFLFGTVLIASIGLSERALAAVIVPPVVSSLVENGGFEDGWDHWTPAAWEGQTAAIFEIESAAAHGGDNGAFLTCGYLSQSLSTVPGQSYELSFWLNTLASPYSIFEVWWGPTSAPPNLYLAGEYDVDSGWEFYHFTVTASESQTLLTIGFDPPFYFDDVQVSATPEPATFAIWSLLGAAGMTGRWLRRRKAG